jgi:hypothetical protein
MNLEGLVPLLVKLAAMAAIASVVARSNTFQSMLMRETRTLPERAILAAWLGVVFAASVAVRIAGRNPAYQAADLGLEGSLIAGLLRLRYRPALRNPDFAAHLLPSRIPDITAAGQYRRAGRAVARPGAHPRGGLALHPVSGDEHLPLL